MFPTTYWTEEFTILSLQMINWSIHRAIQVAELGFEPCF
jgi:hypothetical protein